MFALTEQALRYLWSLSDPIMRGINIMSDFTLQTFTALRHKIVKYINIKSFFRLFVFIFVYLPFVFVVIK